MKLEFFKQKSSNLFAENRLLKLALLVLIIISGINWSATHSAMDSQKTILMPIGASGDLWVTTNDASDDYKRFMMRYVTNMIGNYTASTARKQFEELLVLFSTDSYAKAKVIFEKLADDIERYPTVTSQLIWSGRDPLQVSDKRLIVSAIKNRLVNGDITKSSKTTIEIKYVIKDGRFWITNLSESTPEKHRTGEKS